MSSTELRVLNAFPPPPGETWGLELSRQTGLGAGTVTQALHRLEADALIESRWEGAEEARADGRPPRRMYHLTDSGPRERFERREGAGGTRLAAEGA